MKRGVIAFAGFLMVTTPLFAQFQPQSAQVIMYFPHIADGGTDAAKWQTTFTFVNPPTSAAPTDATVTLALYDSYGTPLLLDLGSGPGSRFSFNIPAGGTRVFRSRAASGTILSGWAMAASNVPLQSIISCKYLVNGEAKQEISATPTLPTVMFNSPATRDLCLAIDNVSPSLTARLEVRIWDAEGREIGSKQTITLPPLNHKAFYLWQIFSNLPQFSGSVNISSADPPPFTPFIAWSLGSDPSGTWSTLPPGAFSSPISHYERIWLLYREIVNAAQRIEPLKPVPNLIISADSGANAINAWYKPADNTVTITLALSQLINDSPSELAFVIAHEIGHRYQFQLGALRYWTSNYEFDADVWGLLLSMSAGYDPYASAGALAKLAFATGTSGLTTQFAAENAADAHKSFNTRLDNLFDILTAACNSGVDARSNCDYYKKVFHPNFPPIAPLGRGGTGPGGIIK